MPGGPAPSQSHGGLDVPGATARTAPPRRRRRTRARRRGRRRPRPSRRPGCCGRPAAVIPIRPPSGVPSPAGPTSTRAVAAAAEHRIGPLLWRALGAAGCARRARARPGRRSGGMADAFRMEALLLLPRAVALAVRPADRGRARAGRVQGAGRGRPLPRARAAADGGHRPPAPPGRPPARARRPARGPDGRWSAPAAATATTPR